MALATATREGRPSVRTVLLKGVDDRGFVFYTNYDSRKARELDATGRASLLFYWRSLERQVRVDGRVEKVSDAESDAYFATRPLESRWSVYASRQSEVIESREALESRFDVARQTLRRRRAAAGVVGRLSRHAGRVRVLAGTSEPAARSAALHAGSRRRLAPRAPRARDSRYRSLSQSCSRSGRAQSSLDITAARCCPVPDRPGAGTCASEHADDDASFALPIARHRTT